MIILREKKACAEARPSQGAFLFAPERNYKKTMNEGKDYKVPIKGSNESIKKITQKQDESNLQTAQSMPYTPDMKYKDKCGTRGDKTAKYRTKWYKYGDKYKLVYTRITQRKQNEERVRDGPPSDKRLEHNIRRSIATIEGLGLCNPWQWWVTLTLDAEKHDRYDVESFKKKLAQWLRNKRRKYKELGYLIVPEQHKDGAWHAHGLLMGIPEKEFSQEWESFNKIPTYIQEHKESLQYWPAYTESFGYCTLEKIKEIEACTSYLCKYMRKSMDSAAIQAGKALYLASQGLKRPEEIDAKEIPKDIVCTSGYAWGTGAAYWHADRTRAYKGTIIDYTTGEVINV